MAPTKVLVLGATGPAGICLLRELLYRQHETVAYVRNPSKIPEDLSSNPLLEVIEGQIDDADKLSLALSKCDIILSLLGPNKLFFPLPSPYPGYYAALFQLMRQHSVRRIFAMGTLSIVDPGDTWSLLRFLMVLIVRILARGPYTTVLGIAQVFKEQAQDLDWTVYRIGGIPGGCDEESWKKDREDGPIYAGYIGTPQWKIYSRRGALARWLVDCVESGAEQWIGKMPAVSKAGGTKMRTE